MAKNTHGGLEGDTLIVDVRWKWRPLRSVLGRGPVNHRRRVFVSRKITRLVIAVCFFQVHSATIERHDHIMFSLRRYLEHMPDCGTFSSHFYGRRTGVKFVGLGLGGEAKVIGILMWGTVRRTCIIR